MCHIFHIGGWKCILCVLWIVIPLLFTHLIDFHFKMCVFVGGEGDSTNHGGPDHEKGHATSFYQVSTQGFICVSHFHTVTNLTSETVLSLCSMWNPRASLWLSFSLYLLQ